MKNYYRHLTRNTGVAIIMALVYMLLVVTIGDFVSTCQFSPYQRIQNPDNIGQASITKEIRHFLAFEAIYGIYIILFGSIMYSITEPHYRIPTLFIFLIIIATYFIGLEIVNFLKEFLEDRECNPSKSNAVSGHFYYFSWTFFVIEYLLLVLEHHRKKPSPIIVNILVFILIAVEGFFTFYYGYHSIRQIVFGAIMGTLCSTLVIFISEIFIMPRHKKD